MASDGAGVGAPLHADRDGMRVIGAAVAALAKDPLPADGIHAGEYHRLRAGAYRAVYLSENDLTTVSRVDRLPV